MQLLVLSLKKKIFREDLEELKSLNLTTILGKTLGTMLRCIIDKYATPTFPLKKRSQALQTPYTLRRTQKAHTGKGEDE